MTNVVSFTGGKHCAECGEQISPKRLQVCPEARLCTACQQERDTTMAKAANTLNQCGRNRHTVQSRGSITIRW